MKRNHKAKIRKHTDGVSISFGPKQAVHPTARSPRIRKRWSKWIVIAFVGTVVCGLLISAVVFFTQSEEIIAERSQNTPPKPTSTEGKNSAKEKPAFKKVRSPLEKKLNKVVDELKGINKEVNTGYKRWKHLERLARFKLVLTPKLQQHLLQMEQRLHTFRESVAWYRGFLGQHTQSLKEAKLDQRLFTAFVEGRLTDAKIKTLWGQIKVHQPAGWEQAWNSIKVHWEPPNKEQSWEDTLIYGKEEPPEVTDRTLPMLAGELGWPPSKRRAAVDGLWKRLVNGDTLTKQDLFLMLEQYQALDKELKILQRQHARINSLLQRLPAKLKMETTLTQEFLRTKQTLPQSVKTLWSLNLPPKQFHKYFGLLGKTFGKVPRKLAKLAASYKQRMMRKPGQLAFYEDQVEYIPVPVGKQPGDSVEDWAITRTDILLAKAEDAKKRSAKAKSVKKRKTKDAIINVAACLAAIRHNYCVRTAIPRYRLAAAKDAGTLRSWLGEDAKVRR